MPSASPLFRRQALEHSIQRREKTVLPRLAKPPIFFLLWMLLALAALALMVAWLGQIPVYLSGPGVIVKQTVLPGRQVVSPAMALVFVAVASAHTGPIRVGDPVQLRIATEEQSVSAIVDGVAPSPLSPDEIERRYALGSRVSALITGPSLVVSLKLGSTFASSIYQGSLLTAQIQVGFTSVLSSWLATTQVEGA
jgi:hypothetical protein